MEAGLSLMVGCGQGSEEKAGKIQGVRSLDLNRGPHCSMETVRKPALLLRAN